MALAGRCLAGIGIMVLSGCISIVECNADQSQRANAILDSIIERDGGPGVSAAVVIDGELVWNGAAGHADLESGVELTVDTRMRIGSVSKPITAALLLRLREQDLIDLDEDVRELIPEFASNQERPVSARMLAAHISGVRQYDFANYLDANNVYYYPSLSAAFAGIADDPLLSEPGAEFLYSSIGYNILGIAAERASELSFAEVVMREVAIPLGLSNTLIDHPLEVIPNRTRFYTRFPDGVTRNTIWRDSSDYYPSGGMLSTANDLARLTSAVFGGQWLSTESMGLLTTEVSTTASVPVPTGYTFGWQIVRDDNDAVKHYEHGGETNGAYAFVRYYPDSHMTIAGVMNANFAAGEPYFFDAISNELPAVFGVGAD